MAFKLYNGWNIGGTPEIPLLNTGAYGMSIVNLEANDTCVHYNLWHNRKQGDKSVENTSL